VRVAVSQLPGWRKALVSDWRRRLSEPGTKSFEGDSTVPWINNGLDAKPTSEANHNSWKLN